MFTKIQMTNFKSWKESGQVRLAPLTAFFGANSSGKSSLLQMLLLIKQTTESPDRNIVLKTDGYVDLGTPSEMTHAETDFMRFALAWDFPPPSSDGTSLSDIRITVPNSNQVITLTGMEFETNLRIDATKTHVESIRYRSPQDNFQVELKRADNNQYAIRLQVNGVEPQRPQGRPRVNMKPQKSYGFSDEALRFYSDTQYLADVVLSFEQQFQRVHYLGPLRDYPKRIYKYNSERPTNVGLRGEDAINALIATKHDRQRAYPQTGKQPSVEERVAQWLVTLGLAHSFKTVPLADGRSEYEVRIRRHPESPEVVLTDLGIGLSQVLPVLVLCYYVPEGSTLILEHPELHLHPSIQAGLADVLIDVIQRRKVQIILESHSEHLLRRLQRRIAEDALTRDQTALYFCHLEGGVSQLTTLELDEAGNILNYPRDFFGNMTEDMFVMAQAGIRKRHTPR